ncbi:MAG TPA: tRNA lysidine(34) synthetase TilS, partial [Gemmatimonadaceae bacterium]|nr:tRNA lysidine(34) synthetase TilS [Gemmatimonadaceae bacterium]
AAASARLGAEEALRRGLPVVLGRAGQPAAGEAAWRSARWAFLRAAAEERGATVATGHTRDDQIETVLLRAMRGAGARGLAGLYADGPVVRPLLELPRALVRQYARARGLRWLEDPSNASRRHARNRVRLDLLPALRRARPSIDVDLLDVARRAAACRHALEQAAASLVVEERRGRYVSVAASSLAGYDRETLRALWPAIAGRAGAVLDRRGTERLAAFTMEGRAGQVVPVSGGWRVVRLRDRLTVGRAPAVSSAAAVPLSGEVTLGRWRFRPVAAAEASTWTAAFPAGAALAVRAWRPGDRIVRGGTRRRVKRFFGDARIGAPERGGWPVVLADGAVVWVPGLCRSDAATDRSGRPAVSYVCELIDG